MYVSGAEKHLDDLLKKRIEEDMMTPSIGRPYSPVRAGYDGARHSDGMYNGLLATALKSYRNSMPTYSSQVVAEANKGLYSKGALNGLYSGKGIGYGGLSRGLYGAGRAGYASKGAGYSGGKGGK